MPARSRVLCAPKMSSRAERGIFSPCPLMSSELHVVQLDGRGAPEQAHRDLYLPLVRDDLFDRAAEVGEGPLGDLDHLADHEGDLLLRLGFRHRLGDTEQPVDLVLAQWL